MKASDSVKKTASNSSGGGFFSRFFTQTKVDDEKLAQLVEMGYEHKQASRNLKKANNDLDRALDLIREEELGFNVDSPEKGSKESFAGKSLPMTDNRIVKLMLFLSEQLEHATRTCFLCGDPLQAENIKLTTCKKEHCEFT